MCLLIRLLKQRSSENSLLSSFTYTDKMNDFDKLKGDKGSEGHDCVVLKVKRILLEVFIECSAVDSEATDISTSSVRVVCTEH